MMVAVEFTFTFTLNPLTLLALTFFQSIKILRKDCPSVSCPILKDMNRRHTLSILIFLQSTDYTSGSQPFFRGSDSAHSSSKVSDMYTLVDS